MSQLQINKSTYNIYKYTAFLSFAVILLLGVAFLQPASFGDNSYAESSSAETTVNLEPTITVWTTDTSDNTITSANIAADPDESVATTTIRAHVSTNNLTGYTLTIQSNSTDAKMVHENESITKTIDPLTGSGTSASSWKSNSNLNNMWGYSIGANDSFVGVPSSSSNAATIDETDTPSNDNYTDITFAAKADLSLPAGTYTDIVIFSAVANALPVKPINNLNGKIYMQDIIASDCASAIDYDAENAIATTYELYDKRTNFSKEYPYYIRKLADGNCWMVENLYLEGGKTLTKSDTNITADTYNLPASSTSGFSDDAAANLFSGGRNRDDYTTTNSGTTYPADGSYMTWVLAKAGTETGGNSDVCPKNWRLPEDSEYDAVADWGYSTFDTRWFADKDGGNNSATPIYPGGHNGSALNSNGSSVRWWSSTQNYTNLSYSLYRVGTKLGTRDSYKHVGYSVRCMLASS